MQRDITIWVKAKWNNERVAGSASWPTPRNFSRYWIPETWVLMRPFRSLLISSKSMSMTIAPSVSLWTAFSTDPKAWFNSRNASPYLFRAWTDNVGIRAWFAREANATASSAARRLVSEGLLEVVFSHQIYSKGIESSGPGLPSGSVGRVNWSRK